MTEQKIDAYFEHLSRVVSELFINQQCDRNDLYNHSHPCRSQTER